MPRTSNWHWAADERPARDDRWARSFGSVALALATLATLVASRPPAAHAQDTTSTGAYARAVASWIGLMAAPGYERLATDRIQSASPGWTRDRTGNLIKRIGDGAPHRVIACGLDEPGYVVSEITDDGYLRVHGIGNARHVALWNQYHEGQRVVIQAVERANPARPRNVPGVFAVRSNHLWRNRAADSLPTSIENLWVDVGARSRTEVERMGIDVLDPVFRDWPEWTYADYVAGPAAGNRAGCAAVAAAAASNNHAAEGSTDYIISVQKSFNWTGLTSALARLGRVDSLFIVDENAAGASGRTPSAPHPIRPPWPALGPPVLDVGVVLGIGVPVRFAGTLTESVSESDIQTLHRAVTQAAGIGPGMFAPVQLAHAWTAAPPVLITDSLARYANVLTRLTDVYAVTGHEQPMRDQIQSLLPAWARDSAVVDSAGNLVLAMGPNRDTAVFVAHLDEIGFEVTHIAHDGTVSLRSRGNFFPFLWEGQTALLHRPDDKIPARLGKLGCGAAREGPLRGIFVPRDSSAEREPRGSLTAWFGRDSVALAADSVQVGSPVTSFKCSARFGDVRVSARSIDDRAGDTALLLALDDIDPAKLDHKVIFVWSVREEGGLLGAKEAAAAFGPSVHRVHAVDTFVSSDSPLESKRFADAVLGQGAALRSLDNSSVTPPDEIDRVLRLARVAAIPVQVGVTNGGNDGSEFARVGALDVAFGWPLRYSHSPAEVMDLRDLRSLTRLVAAVAKAPTMPQKR